MRAYKPNWWVARLTSLEARYRGRDLDAACQEIREAWERDEEEKSQQGRAREYSRLPSQCHDDCDLVIPGRRSGLKGDRIWRAGAARKTTWLFCCEYY